MAEAQSHDYSARDEAYLRAFEGILRTQFGRRRFEAAAKAIERLQQEQEPRAATKVPSILRRFKIAILAWRRSPLPLGAAAVLLIGCVGLLLYSHGRAATGPQVGKFAAVTGTPRVQHLGQTSLLSALPSTGIRLGDRIETGDADKTEIQFNDGTTLRLNFNTTLVIAKTGLQRSAGSQLQRPSQVVLLAGQVWSKVQKLTNAPGFAVETPVATATVKGTEFRLKLQKSSPSKPPNQSSKINAGLLAILTVREGTVQFSNTLGSVEASALTESEATADSAPTQPQRVVGLKSFRLNRTGLTVANTRLVLQDEPDYLVYPVGWAGLTLMSSAAAQPAAPSTPTQQPTAVRILLVRPGSPAAMAGLQVGDVISAVNRQSVTNASEVRSAIVTGINRPLALTIQRANQPLAVTVIPAQQPNSPLLPAIPVQAQKALFDATARLIVEGFQHQISTAHVPEAEIELQALLRRYPDVAAVNHNLAFLYESKDELGQAIRHYQRAIELDPYAALYHLNLGNALRSIGNVERYLEEAQEAARLTPGWPLAAFSLGDAYSLLERHDEAVKALDACLELNPVDARLWGQKAEVLLRARQTEAALPVALKAVELDPALASAHITLGNIYDELGRKDEAEAAQRKALEVAPSNESACINLAHLLRKRGQLEEAEELYRKAVALEPDDADAFRGLGQVFLARRQAPEAEKWYRKAFELDPNSSGACASLGNILRVLGKLDEGEQLLRKAIDLEPDNAEAHVNLGILYWQRKQWAEAEHFMLKAAALDSSMPVERFLRMVYQSQGKLDQEEQALRRWLARNPDDLEPRNELAWHLAERAIKLDEALTLATRAAELAPTDAGVLDTLGWVYYQRGELDQAEVLLKKAVDLSGEGPATPAIREHLKKVYEKKAHRK
jgi:superkiller protein 3